MTPAAGGAGQRARALAEEIVALLLGYPALCRYRAVQMLQAGLLREVAAGSLRELEEERLAFSVGLAAGRRELAPHPREGEDILPGDDAE